MAQLNANTPYIPVYVKNSFLCRNEDTSVIEGYIFGVKSQINRPLMFHVQLQNGAVFWSVPLTAIQWKKDCINEIDISDLQIWDNQSNDIAVTKFSFLENKNVDIRLTNGKWIRGSYMFTIDNYEGDSNYINVGYSGFSDEKVFHFIKLENGYFGVYPNNHLRFHNKDFVKPYPLNSPPKYRPFQDTLSCEKSDVSAADSEFYFYEYNKIWM